MNGSIRLFPSLLGPGFATLPVLVQGLHLRAGTATYAGRVDVVRGTGLISRLCGWSTRLPPAGRWPIAVEIEAGPSHERWTRSVGRHAMRSRLWAAGGLLCERIGPVTFGFRLTVEQERIVWKVVRVRLLGVPLPARAFSNVMACEAQVRGRYRFDVAATLPLIGPLVRYRGWLHVEP